MPIKDQVTNLELSKELSRLLGDKAPESAFYWNIKSKKITRRKTRKEYKHYISESGSDEEEIKVYNNIPAYSVPELFVILPKEYNLNRIGDHFGIIYENNLCQEIFEKNPANAMARMAIYLIKNGIIKL